MAIYKPIVQKNGLELSYHRIALINIDIHNQITMLVYSYVNEQARLLEKEVLTSNTNRMDEMPYTYAEYLYFKFDDYPELFQGDIIQKAYDVLKKQDNYKDSINILEEGQTTTEYSR